MLSLYPDIYNLYGNSPNFQKTISNKKEVKLIENLLNPKIDYVFKRIFGHIGNEEITKSFIEAITKEKLTDIKLDCNTITEKNLFDDKIGILDIKAKLNNNINCNIEMQIVDRKNIEKRILYYWSKMYTSSIKTGYDFDSLEKSIVILISDYNLENLREIKKYITKWNLREKETPKVILTDVLEIYIIELSKVKNNASNNYDELNAWLKFINNPEEKPKMEENKELMKARKILQDMSKTKEERYLAELREKYIMDQNEILAAGYHKGINKGLEQGLRNGLKDGIQQGLKQGMEKGIQQGLKQGMEKGIQQGLKQGMEKGIQQGKQQLSDKLIEIAKKLKQKNIAIEIITETTGLTEEEINKL